MNKYVFLTFGSIAIGIIVTIMTPGQPRGMILSGVLSACFTGMTLALWDEK